MKNQARVASIVLLTILILGLAEAQFHFLRRLGGNAPLNQRELATQFLAEYLADRYPGKKAIVLSNPFSLKPGQPREIYQFEKAGLRGLRRGFGDKLHIEAVVFPELKAEFYTNRHAVHIDPATTTPLSYVVADDSLDKLATQHPGAEIIISLIGLPAKVVQSETWSPANPRKFGLLLPDLRLVGEPSAIVAAIRSRKIAAIVLNKPGAPSEDQPLGHDRKMEFERRFLLVTPETVEQYLRAYPRLF